MKINKTTVLTALSVVGVIGTTAVTAYMAPKADRAIKARELEIANTNDGYSDIPKDRHGYPTKMKSSADTIELVKAAAPYYIPTAIGAIATITCILLSNKEYKKGLIAASATSAYLAANRDKLKKLTEKPEVKKIIDKVLPTKEEFKHQTIETTGNGDLLCIEEYSGRIFRSSREAVIDAEEKLNEMYINPECGYCCLNDFYRFLGIEESQFGWFHGWANTDEEWYPNEPIEFSNEDIAADAPGNNFGEPICCIAIQEWWYPMEGWMEV